MQEPIIVRDFKTENLVVCGYCKGTGIDKYGELCEKCNGRKVLLRRATGTVRLYAIPHEEDNINFNKL
jgi:DnaJ-class molecular chaperone